MDFEKLESMFWWMDVPRPLRRIRGWIADRTWRRHHVIKTGLPPGWHDTDERILHGMFALLVEFVEIELAYMQLGSARRDSRRIRFKYWMHWWLPFTFRRWDRVKSGLLYLDWEIQLKHAECTEFERPSFLAQSVAAQETMDLYKWWVVVRPLRPDPMDASGYTEIWEQSGRTEFEQCPDRPGYSQMKKKSPEIEEARTKAAFKSYEIEEAYRLEDDEMLIRLIRNRHRLWT